MRLGKNDELAILQNYIKVSATKYFYLIFLEYFLQ